MLFIDRRSVETSKGIITNTYLPNNRIYYTYMKLANSVKVMSIEIIGYKIIRG